MYKIIELVVTLRAFISFTLYASKILNPNILHTSDRLQISKFHRLSSPRLNLYDMYVRLQKFGAERLQPSIPSVVIQEPAMIFCVSINVSERSVIHKHILIP